MNPPLITIGIACYNAADSIERAISSAAVQDWPNTEIIIVDDCSRDESVKTVENAIQAVPHAKMIRHEKNKGPAGTRNTILENARGEFVVFFDDDDESLPRRLSGQYERITNYEQETGETLIACYASGERRYPNGYTLDLHAIGSQGKIPRGPDMADRLLFFGGPRDWFYGSGTPTCSLMARKSTFEAVGNFDESFRRVEDIDFAVRLALAGGHFIGCPEKLFIQYSTQGTDKSHAMNLEAEIKLADKHQEYLKSVNRYAYAREWPRIRFYHFQSQYGRMAAALASLAFRHPFKVASHLLATGPARLAHERKMNKKQRA